MVNTLPGNQQAPTQCPLLQRNLLRSTIQHRPSEHVLLSWLPTIQLQAASLPFEELMLHFDSNHLRDVHCRHKASFRGNFQCARILQRRNDNTYVLHYDLLHRNRTEPLHHVIVNSCIPLSRYHSLDSIGKFWCFNKDDNSKNSTE